MGTEFTYFQPLYGAQDSFIYTLTIILLLLTIVSFIRSRYDVLDPIFIYNICLTGCCALAALYTRAWNLPMHFNSMMIIITMSIFFFIGGIIAERSTCTGKYINRDNSSKLRGFYISWPLWIFFIVILLYFIYLNYVNFLALASQVTDETEFAKMLGPVNSGFVHKEIETGRWAAYRLRFASGMAYLSILAIWINLMAKQYQEIFKWSCFVILYFPFIVFTAGRQQFMYLIMFAMISFFLIYRKWKTSESHLEREFLIIAIAIGAFLICFLGMGVINGKVGANTDFLKVLVHYAGTNISAFDVYINEMVMPDNQYIGATTLTQIYGFLYTHGFDVPRFFQYITLFTAFGPVTTNVYTAFARYINDYGYLGCLMIMFLIGFFYTYFYKQIYCHGLKNWMILVYASISYPIFLMGREERFFNEILSTSKFSFIIELLILYKFFEFMSLQRGREK